MEPRASCMLGPHGEPRKLEAGHILSCYPTESMESQRPEIAQSKHPITRARHALGDSARDGRRSPGMWMTGTCSPGPEEISC